MFVQLIDPIDNNDYKIAVYSRVDHRIYTINDIRVKDDLNLPIVSDENLIGYWKCIDFIFNKDEIIPRENNSAYLSINNIIVNRDNKVMIDYGEKIVRTTYTKDYIFNLCLEDTLCKYDYKIINNDRYLIVEWKNGDYVFGKMISGYYVFKKEKL